MIRLSYRYLDIKIAIIKGLIDKKHKKCHSSFRVMILNWIFWSHAISLSMGGFCKNYCTKLQLGTKFYTCTCMYILPTNYGYLGNKKYFFWENVKKFSSKLTTKDVSMTMIFDLSQDYYISEKKKVILCAFMQFGQFKSVHGKPSIGSKKILTTKIQPF